MLFFFFSSIPGGIRTRNLKIRSLAPYPLGHGDQLVTHVQLTNFKNKRDSTPTGFEPVRAEPNGLAGRRLNHSAKVSLMLHVFFFFFSLKHKTIHFTLRDGESNPGHLRDRQRCYQLHHRGSIVITYINCIYKK